MTTIPTSLIADAAGLWPERWRRVAQYARRKWWIPVLSAMSICAAILTHSILQPPSYTATGRLWLAGKMRLSENGYYAEDLQNFLGTQVDLMKSPKIRQRAFGKARASTNSVRLDKVPAVDVSQPRRTTIFVIQATDANPQLAEDYVNGIMDEYLAFRRETRALSSDDTAASLTDQLAKQERDLRAIRDRFDAFQSANNTVVLEEEGSSASHYLTRLNLQLADLQAEYHLLDAEPEDASLRRSGKEVEPRLLGAQELKDLGLDSPSGASGIYSARQQLEYLKINRDELAQYLNTKHPKMVRLQEIIAQQEKLIEVLRQQSKERLETTKASLKLKIEGLEQTVKTWETKVLASNRLLVEHARLKADVQRSQNLYDHLLQLVQSVDLNKNVDQENIALLDRAVAVPAPRRLVFFSVLALLVGGAMGLASVLFLERMDDRLYSPEDFRVQVGERLLGQVPEVLAGRKNGSGLLLLEPSDPRHALIESFRQLRAALRPSAGESPRTLLVTSAVRGEGKTTTALNLARVLAFGGARVLLVDADLRGGKLHEPLGASAEPGLSELLRGQTDLTAVLRPTSIGTLSFIPRGAISDASGELAASAAMEQFLRQQTSGFDFVVLDSTAVLAAADAHNFAPKVEGVLLVARCAYSKAGQTRQALTMLQSSGVRMLGAVVNGVEASAGGLVDWQPGH